jgi:hypothetical protein
MIRVRADDLLFPVIFFSQNGFVVWRDSRSVIAFRSGQLVDREGRCYTVVGADDPFSETNLRATLDERRRLTPDEWRRTIRDQRSTLVCEGEPVSTSVHRVREKIVFLVSAQGHFESPTGFGLPPALATATTVWELLEVLGTTREVDYLSGSFSPWSKPLSILK